ncbi:hypothetical protein [Glycomyces salinus]|uniref:hypothetical protein n=1 Tax=Glycomyces salinus TaxID=980294 RepID=UPI0018EDA175|nr:hypothetical protein [Glycomyces salinus]
MWRLDKLLMRAVTAALAAGMLVIAVAEPTEAEPVAHASSTPGPCDDGQWGGTGEHLTFVPVNDSVPTEFCTLAPGHEGPGVAAVQNMLIHCYGQDIERNGIWDEATTVALENAQHWERVVNGKAIRDDGQFTGESRFALEWPIYGYDDIDLDAPLGHCRLVSLTYLLPELDTSAPHNSSPDALTDTPDTPQTVQASAAGADCDHAVWRFGPWPHDEAFTPMNTEVPTEFCVLDLGDQGWGVVAVQNMLIHCYGQDIELDGVFDQATATALQTAQYWERQVSGKAVRVDGIYSTESRFALLWPAYDEDNEGLDDPAECLPVEHAIPSRDFPTR